MTGNPHFTWDDLHVLSGGRQDRAAVDGGASAADQPRDGFAA